MRLEAVLTAIGFREPEAKVYLALLELGESTVQPLARKAGVQRTYCYDILQLLADRGAVSMYERGGRRRYIAEDPLTIERHYAERGQQLSSAVPELRSIYNHAPGKPKMRYYEGKEGLISIYEELPHVRSYCSITSPDDRDRAVGPYVATLAKRIDEKRIPGRELVTEHAKGIAYLADPDPAYRQIRPLPKGARMETDILIFDNKLVLISCTPDIHAVTIESPAIVQTHQTMFDLLWKAAKPVRLSS